ncbi:MAG TPA: SPFH domain-containing protein [Phycisphaerales bacterium]
MNDLQLFSFRRLSPDEPGAGGPAQPTSGRRASVQLSRGGVRTQSQEDLLASANKSLAEALAITLRIVQVSMLALFLLFAFSGFQTVREGQEAIRLLFGKTQARNLKPGLQVGWPYPIGELVKVNTGTELMMLDSDFWPRVDEKQKGKSINELSKEPRLNPDNDGSLITADANLAHAQWSIKYKREDTSEFAANILPADEQKIVRAACARGIVRAVAQTRVEDLMKQSAGELGLVAARAKDIAQKQLDEINSGIRIEAFELTAVTPPMYVRDAFNNVQSAAAKAASAVSTAEQDASLIYNRKAGEVMPILSAQIDKYELAVVNNDEKAKVELLATIDALLEGKPVTIDGQLVQGKTSGEVARIISEAHQYTSEVVNQRRAELATFQAKLGQYRSNPRVMLHREWTEALQSFLDRDTVQLVLVPPGTKTLEIKLNEDPAQAKRRNESLRLQDNRRAEEQRLKAQREAQFNTTPKSTATQ